MVKMKNANIGKGENVEEGGSSRGRGKGKRVPYGVRAPDRFISVREATNFEEWTRKRRNIAPGHRVDLNNMEGMEIIPNLFNSISWVSLLNVDELYYPEMIYEFYANLYKGRVEKVGNITHQWVLSRIRGRDIAFDDRRMNFGFMAIEHMLATQSSSTKYFPYGCFFTKIFHHFVLNLIRASDHIGPGKIYNKHTFTRMGFEKNDEGQFVRGGQDDSNEDDDDDEENEEQEGMNMDEEESDTEPECKICGYMIMGSYVINRRGLALWDCRFTISSSLLLGLLPIAKPLKIDDKATVYLNRPGTSRVGGVDSITPQVARGSLGNQRTIPCLPRRYFSHEKMHNILICYNNRKLYSSSSLNSRSRILNGGMIACARWFQRHCKQISHLVADLDLPYMPHLGHG
ncbi:hypothetical protein M9H77_30404 [Catharanthus roseus]|uniref:Uncharacterized protein n=1 Tax=Catharanthus roseus TaxID=4058 RepID=A0ACB9ZX62_CATRO|nr:hypothetical protein M9H77_30404 [Catharanthus roseus]